MTSDPQRSTADRSELREDPLEREPLAFELPISFVDRQRVETLLLDREPDERSERIRFNALATLAIAQYCKYIGLVPDLDRSQLWGTRDFSLPGRDEVADLPLPDGRVLECRPYCSGDAAVAVPRSVWRDRAGFLAVEISEDLGRATISGFLSAVDRESVPLGAWSDLDPFLDALLERPQEDASKETSAASGFSRLDDWFSDLVQAGWSTLEDIKAQLGLQTPELAFRGGSALQDETSGYSTRAFTRAKLLEFPAIDRQTHDEGLTVPLHLGFFVKTRAVNPEMREVSCHVVPAADETALPNALTLSLIDGAGDTINHAKPNGNDSFGFRMTVDRGERFSVRIALKETEHTEHFVG